MKKLLCVILALLLAASACGLAEGAKPLTPELDAQLHESLQARIDEILSTPTRIVKSDERIPGETYTGTAYYVSPNGNDEWDGLTPETAKQSLKWVMEVSQGKFEYVLEPGDAVFFERGGLYRFDLSTDLFRLTVPQVTYSAYGEGPKPILTASSESGVGAEKWLPVYEDETGVKIWQYYRDMEDIGAIVLDDAIIADRVYEFWTGDGYESCEALTLQAETDQGVVLKGELLPLQESLTEDLKFISRPDLTDMPAGDLVDNIFKGPLYLRCDAGNPGEIYDSVEFSPSSLGGLFCLEASGLVFDNLSLRFAGQKFMMNGTGESGSKLQDTTIQNCELSYCNGCVSFYSTWDNGAHFVGLQEDSLYNIANNAIIRNNYFHDINGAVLTFEGQSGDPYLGSLLIQDNVMVNTGGLRLDSGEEVMQHFESVVVRGNHIWNTGAVESRNLSYGEGALFLTRNHYGEYILEDNVFYCTEKGCYSNALINTALPWDWEYSKVQYANNTYVQYSGRDFAYVSWDVGSISIDDPLLVERARDEIGEDSGTFYVIGGEPATPADIEVIPAIQGMEIEDDWDAIIAAIDDGSAHERYAVGSTKALDLGEFGVVRMQLAGFDLDERADGTGKAATTWIAVELLPGDRNMDEDAFLCAGGWRDSDLRAFVNGAVFEAIPENVRQRIVTVKKRQKLGDEWQETEDAVWIPDAHELFGADALYYDLFMDSCEARIKRHDNDQNRWWLRSALNNDHFAFVGITGARGYNFIYNASRVVACFCL